MAKSGASGTNPAVEAPRCAGLWSRGTPGVESGCGAKAVHDERGHGGAARAGRGNAEIRQLRSKVRLRGKAGRTIKEDE